MKKGIIISLILAVALLITGCDVINKDSGGFKAPSIGDSNNTTYKCSYTKEEEKQTISAHTVVTNRYGIPISYSVETGYSNATDDYYDEFCSSIKKEDKGYYKTVSTCDKSINKAAVMKTYDLPKIEKKEEFPAITNYIKKFTKDDGTFDSNAFKDYYMTSPIYAGKYTCDFK